MMHGWLDFVMSIVILNKTNAVVLKNERSRFGKRTRSFWNSKAVDLFDECNRYERIEGIFHREADCDFYECSRIYENDLQ